MSVNTADNRIPIDINVIETQKLENESRICVVTIDSQILEALKRMNQRVQNGFHDLVLFVGPSGQSGATLFLNEAHYVENPLPNTPFNDIFSVINPLNRELKDGGKNAKFYGIGTFTSMGEERDLLNLGNAIHFSSTRNHENGQSGFKVKGDDGRAIAQTC